jgi:hypothetical protein
MEEEEEGTQRQLTVKGLGLKDDEQWVFIAKQDGPLAQNIKMEMA